MANNRAENALEWLERAKEDLEFAESGWKDRKSP